MKNKIQSLTLLFMLAAMSMLASSCEGMRRIEPKALPTTSEDIYCYPNGKDPNGIKDLGKFFSKGKYDCAMNVKPDAIGNSQVEVVDECNNIVTVDVRLICDGQTIYNYTNNWVSGTVITNLTLTFYFDGNNWVGQVK